MSQALNGMLTEPHADQGALHAQLTHASDRLPPNLGNTGPPTDELAPDYWIHTRYRNLALLIEALVAVAILVTGVAQAWDAGQGLSLVQAMLMPVVYAVVQIAGVWVQIATWSHPSGISRVIGACASIAIAFVTMIALMLATLAMYQTREGDLLVKEQQFIEAKAELASLDGRIGAANVEVVRWATAAASALTAVSDLAQRAGSLPKDICTVWSTQGADGRIHRQQSCHADPRTSSALTAAQASKNQLVEADMELGEAKKRRELLDRTKSEERVVKAQVDLRRSMLASTLHMMAGVWFQKPATDVSEAEINKVLFIFVVVASAAVAFCGQALAILAVQRRPNVVARQRTALAGPAPEPATVIVIRRGDRIEQIIDLWGRWAHSKGIVPPWSKGGDTNDNKPSMGPEFSFHQKTPVDVNVEVSASENNADPHRHGKGG
jgi:hypothetical protein